MASKEMELAGLLADARRELLPLPSSANQLLPFLNHCLLKVAQSPGEALQDALSTLQKALVAKELLNHSAINVRIAVASFLSQIIRISAPEPPYEDDIMKECFRLIVWSFKNLSAISSRSYGRRVSILETAARVMLCNLMLDLKCDSLIIEMFRHFLDEIRYNHEENVCALMETIMSLIFDQSEDISAVLLCTLLDRVKKDQKSFSMAKKLGEKLLMNCAKKLRPCIVQAINLLGEKPDDYGIVVASICSGTGGGS